MENTTYKPFLSKLKAAQEALAALVEFELPTIQLDSEPERKGRQSRSPNQHGQRAAGKI